MADTCINRCRLARRLIREGIVEDFPIFSRAVNEDGEPIGEYIPIGNCRGYRYTKSSHSLSISVDIPGHTQSSDNEKSCVMLIRCDLCNKCSVVEAEEGNFIELDGVKHKIISLTDNRKVTQTAILE